MSEPKKSEIKSFRMRDDVIEVIKTLKKVDPSITMQKVITDALDEYLHKNLNKAQEQIEDDINVNEYMYIPLKYYAMFNDLSKIDIDRMIKWKEVKSIKIGGSTLIMIDVNENIYKKAELLVIKGNVSSVMKEINSMKKEISKLKSQVNE